MILFFDYYKRYFNYSNGDSVNVVFSDGTTARLTYQPIVNVKDFTPVKVLKTDPVVTNLAVKTIDEQTAYLRIKSFGFSDVDNDSLRSVMNTISHSSCRNLIVDIRNNPGGNEAYATLFSMLADKPFKNGLGSMVNSNNRYNFLKYVPSYSAIDTMVLFGSYKKIKDKEGYYSVKRGIDDPDKKIHFSGKVYVLTNERSYSASTLFAALVHKYRRGTVIGRETGTCYYQMNAYKFANIQLDNSGLELCIPLVKEIFDDQPDPSIPWGHGVIPDHIIGWTYDEYLNNSDPILDYTLKLIRESK